MTIANVVTDFKTFYTCMTMARNDIGIDKPLSCDSISEGVYWCILIN
jgi:hypothetical protein